MQIGNWNQEYEGEEGKPSAKSHKNQEHKIKYAHVTHIPLYSVYKQGLSEGSWRPDANFNHAPF